MKNSVRVFVRSDGLINLYLYHTTYHYLPRYKEDRNSNKAFINQLRKQFPEVRNEFREVPLRWDEEGYDCYSDRHFCAYGLTKAQYIMLKLSWTYDEIKVHNKKRNGKPIKSGLATYFDPTYCGKPTSACEARFNRPGFKQKPLRLS